MRERVLIAAFLLTAAWHGLYGHLLPSWVLRRARHAVGNAVSIGDVRVGFPLRVVFVDVAAARSSPGTELRIRRITVVPQWVSWARRTLWLRRVSLDEPRFRIQRLQEGRIETPLADFSQALASALPAVPASADAGEAGSQPVWHVIAETVQVAGGTVEFVDERVAQSFRGSLANLSFVGGPFAAPRGTDRFSLAVQGRLIGHREHAAPLYCSGWLHLGAKALDISCQLEPLPLAAFEPYYEGPLKVRVYDARLKATGRLTAQDNAVEGRIQLEIDQLSEADLSFLGKTVADIKKLAGDSPHPVLTGELQLSGPMDVPADWRLQLAPGNEMVENILEPLFKRRGEAVKIKVGQQTIEVGLTPTSDEAKTGIQETSKTVQETLKLVAPPPPSEPAAPAPVETPVAQ